jgi:Predicted transcriptional regulators
MANKKSAANKKSKYQKFIVETINRQEIKNADYNPRIIDDANRKKLKKALQQHGLIEPIIWNRRTGNIVGGHQRMSALDSLERNQEYSLDVSVIDVDEREEAILNVQLNNPSMQGTWDIDLLADMSLDFEIGFDEMGFDDIDIDFLFDGDDRFSEMFETEEAEEVKEGLAEVKEAREQGKERLADRNNIDFYAIIVFADEVEKKEFYKKINTPLYEEYLSANQLERLKS